MDGPLKKHGYELRIDIQPGEEIRLRNGASCSWAGEIEDVTMAQVNAIGSGLKNRAVGMPLMQTAVTSKIETEIIAKFGTKKEIWSLPVKDSDIIYFKGSLYLGHSGRLTFDARKISFNNLMFRVQPKGEGTLFLGLPKGLTSLALEGKTYCTNADYVAVIIGEPAIRELSSKEEFKILKKKGGFKSLDTREMTGADRIYIYGGETKKPFAFFMGGDDDEA